MNFLKELERCDREIERCESDNCFEAYIGEVDWIIEKKYIEEELENESNRREI